MALPSPKEVAELERIKKEADLIAFEKHVEDVMRRSATTIFPMSISINKYYGFSIDTVANKLKALGWEVEVSYAKGMMTIRTKKLPEINK